VDCVKTIFYLDKLTPVPLGRLKSPGLPTFVGVLSRGCISIGVCA